MTYPVHDPRHPHHAVWREYTQSLLDGKPKRVEVKPEQGCWQPAGIDPHWVSHQEYRIARPMLKLSYEVPMPVTEALATNSGYWLADPTDNRPRQQRWCNDSDDLQWLRAGLIYLTESDAQAAIDARNAAMTAALKGAK